MLYSFTTHCFRWTWIQRRLCYLNGVSFIKLKEYESVSFACEPFVFHNNLTRAKVKKMVHKLPALVQYKTIPHALYNSDVSWSDGPKFFNLD